MITLNVKSLRSSINMFQSNTATPQQKLGPMNRELRKPIYNKQMLRNKYEKYHTDKTWEAYRKQRNLVTKLTKRSVRTYF